MKPSRDYSGPTVLDAGLDQATVLGLGSEVADYVNSLTGMQTDQTQMDPMTIDVNLANVIEAGLGSDHVASPHTLLNPKKNSSYPQYGPSHLNRREIEKEPWPSPKDYTYP